MLKFCFRFCGWLFLAAVMYPLGQAAAQTDLNSGNANLKKEASPTPWLSLFNGMDLLGWTTGSASWSVEGGVLRNSRGQDRDWLAPETNLPSGEFTAEIRVKVVDGSRFRLRFAPNFWLGNEGYIRQFALYGSDLTDITRFSDETYAAGKWYLLRVVVDADHLVSFYKNGVLSYTAKLKTHPTSHPTIHAGDGFSEGHIEISAFRLAAKALRPPPVLRASAVVTDNFTEGPLAGLWRIKTNGASVAARNKELAFLPPDSQDSFAAMTSREDALPAGSSWKVEIRFRFPHRGPYGVGLGVCEANNLQKRPLWIQYDGNLKQPQMQMGEKEIAVARPNAWHALLITNEQGHWSVSLDGKTALSGDFAQTDYMLYFGNDAAGFKSWDWTTLALQSVRIEYMQGPRPDWLTNL